MDDDVAVATTTGVAQRFDLHALEAFAPVNPKVLRSRADG
jgi:hypothetical protein